MKLQSCIAFWYFVPIGLHPQKSKGHFNLPRNCLNTDLCTVKCFDHCLRWYLNLKEVSSCKHGRSISKSPMWPCCGAGGWGEGKCMVFVDSLVCFQTLLSPKERPESQHPIWVFVTEQPLMTVGTNTNTYTNTDINTNVNVNSNFYHL